MKNTILKNHILVNHNKDILLYIIMYYNIEDTNKFALKFDNMSSLKYTKLYHSIIPNKVSKQPNNNTQKQPEKNVNKTCDAIYNIHNSSYLWMLYVMLYGYDEYEFIEIKNYFNIEQQFRFKIIELLNKVEKQDNRFKTTKFKILVNEIGNDKDISLETFISLLSIFNLNICLTKKYIASIITNNDCLTYWVCNINNKTLNKDIEQYTKEKLDSTYYLVENIRKPFKSISFYKANELREICEKLNIDTLKDKKNKTKKDLYFELMNKIEL